MKQMPGNILDDGSVASEDGLRVDYLNFDKQVLLRVCPTGQKKSMVFKMNRSKWLLRLLNVSHKQARYETLI